MRVVVDVDGVLANAHGHILARFNKEHDSALTKADIKNWNQRLLDTTISAVIRNYYRDDKFLVSMPPMDGAIDAFRQLERNHHIIIATDRLPRCDQATKWWLSKWRFHYDEYLNTDTVGKSSIDADILVDDKPENIKEWSGSLGILFDQPWNRGYKAKVRATSWPDVILEIQLYGEEEDGQK